MPEQIESAHDGMTIYDEILDRVSEGQSVDWSVLMQDHPDLAREWRRLREVQSISVAWRSIREALDTPAAPSAASLDLGPETAATRQPNLVKGMRWGPLVILGHIGQGSFGDVYRAHDPVLDRDVALKLLRPDAGLSLDTGDEGRLLASIDHPGVVRIYGAAHHNDQIGLWMDLAEGRALDQRLADDGRCGEHEALDIARQLTDALAAIHAAGIVHGDVKAANVFRRDGGRWVLGDFGSSLDLRRGTGRPGSATPLAAAPEVLRGALADPRSDLYSLGVLLHLLVVGDYPFQGSSVAELLEAHMGGQATALRERRPEMSSGFSAIIDKALAVDPEQRWQSATQLGDALAALPGHDASRAPAQPTSSSEHDASWLKLLGAVGGVVVLAVIIAIAMVGQWPRWSSPTFVAPAPENQPSENRASENQTSEEQTADGPASERFASQLPNLALMRGGESRRLRTGDQLRMGDALHLNIRGNDAPMWIYVVNEDAEGQTFTLFPLPDVAPANPLPIGDWRLPGQLSGVEQDWVVTSSAEHESFLVIASRQPLPAVEAELARLSQASPDRRPDAVSSTILSPASVIERGVGGLEDALDAIVPTTLARLETIARAEASTNAAMRAEIVTLRGAQVP